MTRLWKVFSWHQRQVSGLCRCLSFRQRTQEAFGALSPKESWVRGTRASETWEAVGRLFCFPIYMAHSLSFFQPLFQVSFVWAHPRAFCLRWDHCVLSILSTCLLSPQSTYRRWPTLAGFLSPSTPPWNGNEATTKTVSSVHFWVSSPQQTPN